MGGAILEPLRSRAEADRWGTRVSEESEESGPCDDATALRRMVTALQANHPPAIEQNRLAFLQGVRQVRRVRPTELATMAVRIYGGRVPVWQEGRINSQLAKLGSDLRLYVARADVLRTADLATKLGAPPKEPPALDVFLLGVARPCTSYFKAQLFEFDHEYAVSPYIHPESPGIVDQCRIVLRHRFFHGIVVNVPGSGIAEGFALPILRHEEAHVLLTYGFKLEGHFAAWRPVVRADICRFARQPRTYGDIAFAFYKTFEDFELAPQMAMGMLPPNEPRERLKLADILGELLADELLVRTNDDKFVSRFYEDGRAWSIE